MKPKDIKINGRCPYLILFNPHVAFPLGSQGRHPEIVISELNGWPTLPLSTLHVRSHDRPRMTRGHDGSAHPFI